MTLKREITQLLEVAGRATPGELLKWSDVTKHESRIRTVLEAMRAKDEAIYGSDGRYELNTRTKAAIRNKIALRFADKKVTINGIEMTVREACELNKIPLNIAQKREARDGNLLRAVTTPYKRAVA